MLTSWQKYFIVIVSWQDALQYKVSSAFKWDLVKALDLIFFEE